MFSLYYCSILFLFEQPRHHVEMSLYTNVAAGCVRNMNLIYMKNTVLSTPVGAVMWNITITMEGKSALVISTLSLPHVSIIIIIIFINFLIIKIIVIFNTLFGSQSLLCSRIF